MTETAPIFALLGRALDAAALRQAVHTTNIANADVDGYRRLEVVFQDELVRAAALTPGGTGAFEVSMTPVRVVPSADEMVRLDQEMAQMAQNAVRYQALVGAFEGATGLLRLAIREGRE
jgi:flagellar basal-body rod protein FlgB